ncbi:hypothetical protein BD309DRAFT_968622 [Dichomitus squalens]|nr:hypothetical protein BD309DRAFT_968622 [Dichomitus squalens]
MASSWVPQVNQVCKLPSTVVSTGLVVVVACEGDDAEPMSVRRSDVLNAQTDASAAIALITLRRRARRPLPSSPTLTATSHTAGSQTTHRTKSICRDSLPRPCESTLISIRGTR